MKKIADSGPSFEKPHKREPIEQLEERADDNRKERLEEDPKREEKREEEIEEEHERLRAHKIAASLRAEVSKQHTAEQQDTTEQGREATARRAQGAKRIETDGLAKEGWKPIVNLREAEARDKKAPMRGDNKGALIAVLVLVAIVGGFWLWYSHRPVGITVDGEACTYRCGTSIADIYSDKGVQVTPGNFVSVSGNVLESGKGEMYTATVDGDELKPAEAESYKIKGGESISFSDGHDIMEEYTSQTVEVNPKLVVDGSYGAFTYVSQWGKKGSKEVRTGSVSGETVDGQVYQEAQDCVITIKNIKPDNDQKLIALTFDDGPSKYTDQYLQILQEHGAVATFFCLGNNVETYPDKAKAIVDSGNQICSHSTSHPNLLKLDNDGIYNELTGSFATIESATGVKTTTFRPPYGNFHAESWLATGGQVSCAVIWNLDSEDWRKPGVDEIVENATKNVKPGSVILMHDGGGNRDEDLEALPQIIDKLHEEGYTFVTISDLLKSDSSVPEEITTCSATMPEGCTWATEMAG